MQLILSLPSFSVGHPVGVAVNTCLPSSLTLGLRVYPQCTRRAKEPEAGTS